MSKKNRSLTCDNAPLDCCQQGYKMHIDILQDHENFVIKNFQTRYFQMNQIWDSPLAVIKLLTIKKVYCKIQEVLIQQTTRVAPFVEPLLHKNTY
jgi:hypothetical protein